MKQSDIWLATLNDPRFWQAFLKNVRPLDEAQEARMIQTLAIKTKISASRIRQRKRAYLRACMAEYRGEMHPGTNTAH